MDESGAVGEDVGLACGVEMWQDRVEPSRKCSSRVRELFREKHGCHESLLRHSWQASLALPLDYDGSHPRVADCALLPPFLSPRHLTGRDR